MCVIMALRILQHLAPLSPRMASGRQQTDGFCGFRGGTGVRWLLLSNSQSLLMNRAWASISVTPAFRASLCTCNFLLPVCLHYSWSPLGSSNLMSLVSFFFLLLSPPPNISNYSLPCDQISFKGAPSCLFVRLLSGVPVTQSKDKAAGMDRRLSCACSHQFSYLYFSKIPQGPGFNQLRRGPRTRLEAMACKNLPQ